MNKNDEFFTPSELVNDILDTLPQDLTDWEDPTKTWLDPTCGDGNILVEIMIRLLKCKHDKEHILEEMIFGADIMPDNIEECILRLWGEDGKVQEREMTIEEKQAPGLKQVFMYRKPGQEWKPVRNLVCSDALVYDYSFGRNPDSWDEIGLTF